MLLVSRPVSPWSSPLLLPSRAAENLAEELGPRQVLHPTPQLPARLTRPPPSRLFQNEITHDEHCTACKRGANLQPCGTCPGAYHLSCLDPPLKTAPKGVWVCPKCQQKVQEAVLLGSGRTLTLTISRNRGALPHPAQCLRPLTVSASWVVPAVSRGGEGRGGLRKELGEEQAFATWAQLPFGPG